MRWAAVWGLSVVFGLGTTAPAHSDIYLYRDPTGTLHFTNAPARSATRLQLKDRPVPPAPRMFFPRRAMRGGLAAPIPLATPSAYDGLIREIADRYDLEYALVKAVIKAESDFNRMAVSPKGALGLMQLMPRTAAYHQVRNVFLPRDNIEGGCRHLRMLLERYGGNVTLAVAAYNAGSQRVEDARGIPAIPE